MTTLKLVNLTMRCSRTHPYRGKLSNKDQIFHAIELAELFKKYADDGQTDEAMDIDSTQWVEVINKLKQKKQKNEK